MRGGEYSLTVVFSLVVPHLEPIQFISFAEAHGFRLQCAKDHLDGSPFKKL